MRRVNNNFLLIVEVNQLLKRRVGLNEHFYALLIVCTFLEVLVQFWKVVFHRLLLRAFVENVIVHLLNLLKLEAGLLINLNLLLVAANRSSLVD